MIKKIVNIIFILAFGTLFNLGTGLYASKSTVNLNQNKTVLNSGVFLNGNQSIMISQDHPLAKKNNFKLRTTDNEEEDDVHSSRKELVVANAFSTFIHAGTLNTYIDTFKKRISFCVNLISFSSYRRYIVFQVFRI